jgi:hypothetical protein
MKMRRYDVVSGIIFIIFIIDSALAAPVLVQEKRQARVDVVHMPKDVITVLGKRVNEELEKLLEAYFKRMGEPLKSSDAHASSSSAPSRPLPEEYLYFNEWKQPILESSNVHASSNSAPPGSDYRSTNLVQAPAPSRHLPEEYLYFNTWKQPILQSSDVHASSTSASNPLSWEEHFKTWNAPLEPPYVAPPNPHLPEEYFKTWKPLIFESSEVHVPSEVHSESSSEVHSSSSSAPPESDHGSMDVVQAAKPNPHWPFKTWKPPILGSSEVHTSSSSAPPGSDHGSTDLVQAPAPNPVSLTANPDPFMGSPGPSSTVPMQG